MFQSINPHNGEVVAEYSVMSPSEVASVIDQVDEAFHSFKKTGFEGRKYALKKAAEILRSRKMEFAKLMTTEMGKPVLQGVAEAEKCAWVCDYYADGAESFLRDMTIETDARKSFVSFQPLGVILAIMPWNFPFWQVFRFAAPALMAGNGVLLKHSPNVTGSALSIEKVFKEAGFPDNVFRTIVTEVENVEGIIRNKKVAAVTLTGSTRAGKSVAQIAGSELKKCVLELGGSDPYIIMNDADIESAVKACLIGRMLNTGQSCIAAKRLLIFEKVYDQFKELFLAEVKKLKTGDPMDETNYIGAIARKDLRDTVHAQVQKTIELGATVLAGGYIPEGPGFYYPPTVLENIPENSPAFCEEIFGPVALLFKVKTLEEAIFLANSTDYGLGSAIFTSDLANGETIAKSMLESGSSFVNSFVKSDPRLPFGGIKQSGYGRELSPFGIKEFVNVKTVYIA
ncbi:MAG: NAD-dependent succinate-semialdehyde dehydrogenase [Ignavibacteria bacterium]|nr:NAD-dependent succinate-semialdehyde dehydrogenase [Ignavibacteria bacterium]